MKKKNKLPKMYRESKEERLKRVHDEGGMFRPKVEPTGKTYNRKKAKADARRGEILE